MSLTKPKVVVVMPAYNAAETLRMTYAELPHDSLGLVIVVDDGRRSLRTQSSACAWPDTTPATAPSGGRRWIKSTWI